jgi:exopolysaccharide production protein ExoZ
MEKQRVESIHLLRAVAALMVVFFHSCNAVKGIHGWGIFSIGNTELPRVGAAGVDIFFIISGFVMIMTLGNHPSFDSRASALLDRHFRDGAPLPHARRV